MDLMFRMITELVEHKFDWEVFQKEVTHLRILFPEPAMKSGVVSGKYDQGGDRMCTFSVNP